MSRCLISFGANLGDPVATITLAAEMLHQRLGCAPADFRLSRFYRTPPVGGPTGQPPFANAVVAIDTLRNVWEIWQAVREVELQLGRERFRRWEARRIDIDILLFDNLRCWTPQLKIPHPRMCMRRFILIPAMEVAAEWLDPVSNLTIQELTSRLQDNSTSFLLLAPYSLRPQLLLAEVARLAAAEWHQCRENETGITIYPSHADEVGLAASKTPQRRSVACCEVETLPGDLSEFSISPMPTLLILLAADAIPEGVLWEDHTRQQAELLGLCESQQAGIARQLSDKRVARYLLATDDRAWAIHEMVTALEAMDCPVEVIP